MEFGADGPAKPAMTGRFAIASLTTMIWMTLAGAVHAADQSPKDCRLRSAVQLPMQITPDGRVTIPVRLDGHDYRFMVDTGGYINTVSYRVVADEGYQPKVSYGARLRGVGTTYLAKYVTTKEFIMDRSRGSGFKFFVDDFNDLSWDGTLAPEILATYDLDLDFGHDKFNLFSQDHCPGAIVYWTDTPVAVVPIEMQNRTHIRIPVMIDGKKIMATVDTGTVGALVTQRAAERYLGIARDDPALKKLGNQTINNMSAPVFSYPFKALNFGDIAVANPNIQIVSDSIWDEDDLLLGVNILRQLHVYIAYGERKMYLTPALAGKTAN